MNKPTSVLFTKGLTFAQFVLIAILFVVGPMVVIDNITLAAVQLIGFVLGVYGIYAIGIFNFSAYPTPRKDSILVSTGPFKYIRHPMYLAVLLYCVPIALFHPTTIKTLTVLLLLLILLVKIRVEESLLNRRYSNYKEYKKQSWRLIPFLY